MRTLKKSFRRIGDPKMEHRILQNHLTVLQMYETFSLKIVGKNVADLSNFGNE